jgi:hypothetical protein
MKQQQAGGGGSRSCDLQNRVGIFKTKWSVTVFTGRALLVLTGLRSKVKLSCLYRP